jgi:hypothetical protein
MEDTIKYSCLKCLFYDPLQMFWTDEKMLKYFKLKKYKTGHKWWLYNK